MAATTGDDMEPTLEDIKEGRWHIAQLAKLDGEHVFANEVLAGAWDHRNDVSKAIAGYRFQPRAKK